MKKLKKIAHLGLAALMVGCSPQVEIKEDQITSNNISKELLEDNQSYVDQQTENEEPTEEKLIEEEPVKEEPVEETSPLENVTSEKSEDQELPALAIEDKETDTQVTENKEIATGDTKNKETVSKVIETPEPVVQKEQPFKPICIPKNTPFEYDLNGDGQTEKITYNADNSFDDGYPKYYLEVNGVKISDFGNTAKYVLIVQLNKAEKMKEIAVIDYGMSNDYSVIFYRYISGQIVKLGELEGIFDPKDVAFPNGYEKEYKEDNTSILNKHELFKGLLIEYDGNGKIISKERANVLQTWWISQPYQLIDNHLKKIECSFFETNYETTTLIDFEFFKENNLESETFVVPAGSLVTLSGTDNESWCQINYNGQLGWFRVSDYYLLEDYGQQPAEVLFNNLFLAD